MELKLEEGAYFDFCTHHPSTGAATDADSTPSAEVFEDATDTTVVALTVTKRTSKTGNYRVPVTAAAADGFEVGKTYNVVASATVNSIAGKGVIGRFKVRTRGKDDLAFPQTSGRGTLVAADGSVSPNWADVKSPTTTLNLSGTTVKTATDVETDTQDLQSRLPAALTADGNIKADTLRWGGTLVASANVLIDGAITAAKIASDAITSAKVADGALTAAKFASGAFDAVWSVATRVLTAATNITSTGGTTVPQTGDSYARLGAPAGASVSADVAAVKTDTGNLVTRITSTLFSGITSLAEWLGLMAGKQTGNSTARTELRATGAGSGAFDETTDSQEALRDRGDAAWTTATGFSTLDAAGVRSAVGLASANLDTQLGDLPTNSELTTALNALLTTAMTESYNADGSAPTPAQALFAILQRLTEFSISGTSIIVKKLDGSTTAFILTTDDATSPTSSTRSS